MERTCKRYVGIDPEGSVCGPCTPTEDQCLKALRIGYERTFHKPATDDKIKALGYTVVLATVEWNDGADENVVEASGIAVEIFGEEKP